MTDADRNRTSVEYKVAEPTDARHASHGKMIAFVEVEIVSDADHDEIAAIFDDYIGDAERLIRREMIDDD